MLQPFTGIRRYLLCEIGTIFRILCVNFEYQYFRTISKTTMTFGSYSYQQETGLHPTHNLLFNFDGHSRGDEAIA